MPFDRRHRPPGPDFRGPPGPGRPRPGPGPRRDFGSNQFRQRELREQQLGEDQEVDVRDGDRHDGDQHDGDPRQVDTQGTGEETQGTGEETHLPIYRTLSVGSSGDDVEALQRFLGLEGDAVDGRFGEGTKAAVAAWQEEHGQESDGVVGSGTLAAMRGHEEIYGYSVYQRPDTFVPDYPMMAYHESGSYRDQDDPYAVGAVTNPDKDEDLGGKTYGVYQFESFVHAGGSGETEAAKGSTVMRFVKWGKNPYGKQLQAVIDEHGLASSQFDAAWRKLAAEENEAFGEAQQDFLRHDKGPAVQAWMERAAVSDKVAADDSFFDLVLGTLNHVGTLADGAADHLAAVQADRGEKLGVDEAAQALCDYKLGRVDSWFRSSPDARPGIRNRFRAEKAAFD